MLGLNGENASEGGKQRPENDTPMDRSTRARACGVSAYRRISLPDLHSAYRQISLPDPRKTGLRFPLRTLGTGQGTARVLAWGAPSVQGSVLSVQDFGLHKKDGAHRQAKAAPCQSKGMSSDAEIWGISVVDRHIGVFSHCTRQRPLINPINSIGATDPINPLSPPSLINPVGPINPAQPRS